MDVEFWILAVVPILAAVALCDSITQLSARLSSRLGLANTLWIHLTILILFSVAFFAVLFSIFDATGAFWIKHYVRPQDYWITMTFVPLLFVLDIALISFSVVGALVLAIKQGRNVLLSVLAGMLGTVGTIAWMTGGIVPARAHRREVDWRLLSTPERHPPAVQRKRYAQW
jgi:hypothetical protein